MEGDGGTGANDDQTCFKIDTKGGGWPPLGLVDGKSLRREDLQTNARASASFL